MHLGAHPLVCCQALETSTGGHCSLQIKDPLETLCLAFQGSLGLGEGASRTVALKKPCSSVANYSLNFRVINNFSTMVTALAKYDII